MAPPLKPESRFFVLTRRARLRSARSASPMPTGRSIIVVIFMKEETPLVSAGRKVAR